MTQSEDKPERCLSLVMPVFNEAATLRESLDRVLAQPFVAEVIAVNDASTDNSQEILDSITDPRVKVMHHEINQGKGAAIRTGIQQATAPYVGIQDADLEYDPADLQRLLTPLQAGLADAVYGSGFLTTVPTTESSTTGIAWATEPSPWLPTC